MKRETILSTLEADITFKEISINFNNVAMIQYVQFISRISGKNFIFDDEDLQFNVTIISEEPTSIENLMSALLQELKIRDLSLIEQGNDILIHRNPRVKAPFQVVAGADIPIESREVEIVTRVFRLNTLDPVKASEIIRPLLSEDSLVEVLRDTNNLIITDLVSNINKITQLISTLDAPNSGITIWSICGKKLFCGLVGRPLIKNHPAYRSRKPLYFSSPCCKQQHLHCLKWVHCRKISGHFAKSRSQ